MIEDLAITDEPPYIIADSDGLYIEFGSIPLDPKGEFDRCIALSKRLNCISKELLEKAAILHEQLCDERLPH
jgi:hypothetical protein